MSGMDYGLGRFGDARLEKGGPICMQRWLHDLARASGSWRGKVAPGRCSSHAFFATRR